MVSTISYAALPLPEVIYDWGIPALQATAWS